MYESYFGLSENPFSIAPNPRFLYMSPKHQEALAHLYFSLSGSNRFVLLTGEVGTGKTTLCRGLLEELPEDVDVALILNPRISSVELLAAICDELGIDYPKDSSRIRPLVDRLTQYLLEASERARRTFVIIDEAQNLDVDVLEEVRLLTNIETSTDKLLQIILVGQPELRDKLALPELRQLSQRITARYHLDELELDEIESYLRHRLSVAGCTRRLFDRGAIKALYKASAGTPRLINSIADRALTGAYVQELDIVDAKTVRQAALEILGEKKGEVSRLRLVLITLLVMLLSAGVSYLALNQWGQWIKAETSELAQASVQSAGEVLHGHEGPVSTTLAGEDGGLSEEGTLKDAMAAAPESIADSKPESDEAVVAETGGELEARAGEGQPPAVIVATSSIPTDGKIEETNEPVPSELMVSAESEEQADGDRSDATARAALTEAAIEAPSKPQTEPTPAAEPDSTAQVAQATPDAGHVESESPVSTLQAAPEPVHDDIEQKNLEATQLGALSVSELERLTAQSADLEMAGAGISDTPDSEVAAPPLAESEAVYSVNETDEIAETADEPSIAASESPLSPVMSPLTSAVTSAVTTIAKAEKDAPVQATRDTRQGDSAVVEAPQPSQASELSASRDQGASTGEEGSEIIGGNYEWGVEHLFERWGHSYKDTKGLTFCTKARSVGLRCREGDYDKPIRVAPSYPQLVRVSGLPERQGFAVFTWLGDRGGVLETPKGLHELDADGVDALRLNGALLLWRAPEILGIREALWPGYKGPEIPWLRGKLAAAGYQADPVDSPLFDKKLLTVLRRFQGDKGLDVDGIAGPQTLIYLLPREGVVGTR